MNKKPVKDIKLSGSSTISELVDQFAETGGFLSVKINKASEIIKDMNSKKCTKFLSFPANIIATGTRGTIHTMIDKNLVDVIITTCGTLDHDLARLLTDYYHGNFNMNDAALRDKGVNRLGNVLVPDSSYGMPIEKWMQPFLKEIYNEKERWVPCEIWKEMGKRMSEEEGGSQSILAKCAEKNIPVFVPGLMDGAVRSQLWQFWQDNKKFTLDILQEQHILSDLIYEAEKTGALMIGGGISKHHTIWWNQFRGGLDYVVQITTAPEWDGSLSGARVNEAISWGKVKHEAEHVTLEGDATVILPILISSVLN